MRFAAFAILVGCGGAAPKPQPVTPPVDDAAAIENDDVAVGPGVSTTATGTKVYDLDATSFGTVRVVRHPASDDGVALAVAIDRDYAAAVGKTCLKSPDDEPVVELRFVVWTDGSVRVPKASRNTPAIHACIEREAAAWKLPARSKAAAFTFSFVWI